MNKEETEAHKKKVGVFSLTCDEGCSIMLTEFFNTKLLEWLDFMELFYFLSIKDHRPMENMDIALVEGVVSTEHDKDRLKDIRANTETLIAMGNCAITSMPSGQRNNFGEEKKERISPQIEKFSSLEECVPLKEIVDVEDEVAGCPINEVSFIEIFEKHLKN